ncbi:hypothetical protein NDU88_000438 [Pleurodeles waltl]|uniref:Uncharacterized protein n=1 Tax=Pleurodeles waltl TaxID=8319 RepID=A0AAV7V6Y5_PLEWA|nr:hypothetical protein NDU88_000438 [Pleurodeles waltl]
MRSVLVAPEWWGQGVPGSAGSSPHPLQRPVPPPQGCLEGLLCWACETQPEVTLLGAPLRGMGTCGQGPRGCWRSGGPPGGARFSPLPWHADSEEESRGDPAEAYITHALKYWAPPDAPVTRTGISMTRARGGLRSTTVTYLHHPRTGSTLSLCRAGRIPVGLWQEGRYFRGTPDRHYSSAFAPTGRGRRQPP